MKKWILIMMAMMLVVVAGCGSKKVEVANIQTADLLVKMQEAGGFPPAGEGFDIVNLKENADIASKLNIDQSLLAEGIYMKALINIRADEIIVLKAMDEKDIATLKKALEDEAAAQQKMWENYLPQELDKVKKHIIKQVGPYLTLIIAEKAEDVEKAFDTALQPAS
ncbi:hypothetical protein BVG16_26380 [Paenibacillus selenitireducens]|uniref:DUF4358 domain-containing protein n=1 Tax=Paenibacillus selenitireducens TaxID=1324314 RepID=A0A1T2X277_9BACL|nr:DUF4358 domain-containing protein [Paenibacillus selenitireducens]OPA73970.1 hypothetical protein BVG16_26380 [Paenibacillus selenitireducens]